MVKLTWEDLLVHPGRDDIDRSLPLWVNLVAGPANILFTNRFGCWFLQRDDGHVDYLDVLAGSISRVADSQDALTSVVNQPTWQEEYLHSLFVFGLHQRGKVAKGTQCYAIVPHPALFPDINLDRSLVMSFVVWQTISAQSVGSAPN